MQTVSAGNEIGSEKISVLQKEADRGFLIMTVASIVAFLLVLSVAQYTAHVYADTQKRDGFWLDRQSEFRELSGLAQALDTPGNDVFDSKDVDLETERLKIASLDFDSKLNGIKESLKQLGESSAESIELKKILDEVSKWKGNTEQEAKTIFACFRKNQPDVAGSHMATMDHNYFTTELALNKAKVYVTDCQQKTMALQFQSMADAGKCLFWLCGLSAVIMITLGFHFPTRLRERLYEGDDDDFADDYDD